MLQHLSIRRHLVATVLSVAVLAVGCGRDDAATAPTVDQRAVTEELSTNPFIPEDANIGDCVSSLPRPGCGNQIRGDWHSMITFGVLVAGLAFIGWRVARSVRRRDAPRGPLPRGPLPTGSTSSGATPTGPTPTGLPPTDRTPTA